MRSAAGNVPYSEGVPAVLPQETVPDDYQRIQTRPDEFGMALNRGAEQLSQGAVSAAKVFGQIAADDAANKWQREADNLIWGTGQINSDGTLDRGYIGLSGEEALRARPALETQLDQLRQQYRDGLGSPEQNLQFDNFTRRYQSYLMSRAGAHAEEQSKVYGVSVNDAALANTERAIANNYNDDAQFKELREAQRLAAGKKAHLQGTSEPGALAEADSRAVQARLSGALAQRDFKAAQQIFEQYGSLLDDKTRPAYANHIQSGADSALGDDLLRQAQGHGGARASSGGIGQSPKSGGWGPLAAPAVAEFKKAGASDAFIQGAMANGLGEGGFKDPWQQSWVNDNGEREESFGHWQFNKRGELGPYLASEGKANPEDTAAQARYLVRRMEELQPGITKTSDPKAATDAIAIKFEKYQDAAPGQRYSQLAEAQQHLAGPAAAAPNRPGQADQVTGAGSAQPLLPVAQATPIPPGTAGGPQPLPPVPAPGMADLANAEAELARNHARVIENLKNDPRGQQNPTAWAHAVQKEDLGFRSGQMALTAQKQALTEARNAAADRYVQRMMQGPPDPGIVQQIADDGHLDRETRENLWRFAQQSGQGDRIPSAQSYQTALSAIDRIRLPDGNQNKITDRGQLYDYLHQVNRADWEFIAKQFDDMQTPGGETLKALKTDFLKHMAPQIDHSNPIGGKVIPIGQAKAFEFERFVAHKIDQWRTDKKDPVELFEPSSPNYLGKPEVVARFRPTMQEEMRSLHDWLSAGTSSAAAAQPATAAPAAAVPAAQPGSPVATAPIPPAGSVAPIAPPAKAAPAKGIVPRQPGENPADYLKRIGAGAAASPQPSAPVR
jgi:hypothetical protein